MEYIKCAICNSNDYKTIHKIDVNTKNLRYYIFSRNTKDKSLLREYTIVKCKQCGLIYTNPRLDTNEVKLLYSSNNAIGGNWKTYQYLFDLNQSDNLQNSNSGSSTKVYNFDDIKWKKQILNSVKNLSNKDNLDLLDIGCGDGKFVEFANMNGFNAIGYDINPERIKISKDFNNENTFDKLPNKFKNKKYDIITAWDVIEHVTNLTEFLEYIKDYLKDDGTLVLLTLNVDSYFYKILGKQWYYIDPMQHTYYFSPKTLNMLLVKFDLEIIKIKGDYTHNRTVFNLTKKGIKSIFFNLINRIYFNLFTNDLYFNFLGKYILKYHKIKREQMLRRIDNLYPYLFAENYNDNLVYIIKKK